VICIFSVFHRLFGVYYSIYLRNPVVELIFLRRVVFRGHHHPATTVLPASRVRPAPLDLGE
jgi:hypothetical protein